MTATEQLQTRVDILNESFIGRKAFIDWVKVAPLVITKGDQEFKKGLKRLKLHTQDVSIRLSNQLYVLHFFFKTFDELESYKEQIKGLQPEITMLDESEYKLKFIASNAQYLPNWKTEATDIFKHSNINEILGKANKSISKAAFSNKYLNDLGNNCKPDVNYALIGYRRYPSCAKYRFDALKLFSGEY